MTEALEETEDELAKSQAQVSALEGELAASQGAAGGDAAPDAAAVSLELRTKLAASEARVKDLEAKVKEQDAQLADAASSSAGATPVSPNACSSDSEEIARLNKKLQDKNEQLGELNAEMSLCQRKMITLQTEAAGQVAPSEEESWFKGKSPDEIKAEMSAMMKELSAAQMSLCLAQEEIDDLKAAAKK